MRLTLSVLAASALLVFLAVGCGGAGAEPERPASRTAPRSGAHRILVPTSPALPAAARRCGKKVIDEWYREGRINGTYAVACYRAALDLLGRSGRPLPVGTGVQPPAALLRRLQQIVGSSATHLSILDRARTVADRLPRRLLARPFGRRVLDRPASARLARVIGRRRIFVLAHSRGMVCLAIVGTGRDTAVACVARSVLVNGTAFLAEPRGDDTTRVIGVVPDRRRWVAIPTGPHLPVVGNVFVLQRVPARTIILGSAKGGEKYDIGPQRPPH
jgi:hypothetical protein